MQIFSQCVFEFVMLFSSCLIFNCYVIKLYPFFFFYVWWGLYHTEEVFHYPEIVKNPLVLSFTSFMF